LVGPADAEKPRIWIGDQGLSTAFGDSIRTGGAAVDNVGDEAMHAGQIGSPIEDAGPIISIYDHSFPTVDLRPSPPPRSHPPNP